MTQRSLYMKKESKLYNVIFPIWFLLIFPVGWFLILPANFLIDSIVLLICYKVLDVARKENYKKAILKVWLCGFLADLIGAGLLFATQAPGSDWWYEYITGPVAYNPFDNIYALLYVCIAILLSGIVIYFFNRRFCLQKTGLNARQKHIVALALAIATAPYLFLLPTQLMSSTTSQLENFTNHFVASQQYALEIVATSEEISATLPLEMPLWTGAVSTLADGINTAQKTVQIPSQIQEKTADFQLRFFEPANTSNEAFFDLWLSSELENAYFQQAGSWYQIEQTKSQEIFEHLQKLLAGAYPPEPTE